MKVEYLYSQGLQSNSTFKLNLDVSNIISDIYDIQIAAYNIHNEITTIAYNNVMIDHSGPVVTPLFNDGDFFNNTAGSLSFNIFDPSGVDSASISYSRDYDYPFDYSMEQNAYYGSFDFNNITTESETFYGSFDFRDDADGFNPSGLTVNEDGGTLQVISSLFNHKKVVELHDTNTDDVWMRLSANSQPYGSIEFWISTDDATDRSRLYGNSAGVTSFQIRIDADKFQYWDGAWKDVGLSASDDVWYHVRIDFECTTGGYQGLAQYDWHLYINGNSYGDFNFGNNVANVNFIYWLTYTTDTNYYMYIDAIGVSWDSTSHNGLGYEVGYNANSNDIIPLLNEGYDINHQYGCTISIESAFNHYNVLKLYDDSSTYRTYLIIPFEQSSSQTLEFWFASSTAVDTNYFVLREGSTQIIPFRAVNDDFQYSDGSWKDIKTNFIVANTWYHVKVVLDDTNNDCDVYINGVLEGSNLSYQTSSTTSPDHFWVYTSAGDSGYATYLDAFGVSSDSSSHSGYGYDIGYNINPNDIRPLLEDGFYPFEINYGDSISIESYVDSLENVLHLNDQSSSSVGISKDLSNRTTGILEWWWRTSDSSKRSAVKLYEDDSQRIYLGYLSETFCGYWNDQYQYSTINILSDTWYHHKLKFNCSSDSYDWYINGELALSGLFDNVGDGINRFELKTYNSHTGYDVYFDEIKFTLGFIGDVDVSGNIWTFNFNDALLNGTYGLILFANDSLGYTSTFTNFDIYFDNTKLGFFPDTLPNGYIFNGSNLMNIQNPSGQLFNKSIKSLHVYVNSEYTDLGYYYNLLPDFSNLVIDSIRIPDGPHNMTFEFIDLAGNMKNFTYPIYVDNSPPVLNSVLLNNENLNGEIFFNDQVDLQIDVQDQSEIASVKLFVQKILGDPAIYDMVGSEKNWSSLVIRRKASDPSESFYLNPNNLTYSFYDSWFNGTDDVYQNVLYWKGWNPGIPFINLNIFDIEKAVGYNNVSIPFFFDYIAQEITFDERYREHLTNDIILKGVKCNVQWNTSFTLNGNSWTLINFDVEDYVSAGQPAWWDNLFGFDNDDSIYHVHYDHPQQFMRNRFEFYFEIIDDHGNILTTQNYQGDFDNLRAEGSFGRITGTSSNGGNYWVLGKTGQAGNIMFNTDNEEYNTLYFTPGYIYNSSSDSYYVKYGFNFLHNIESIKLYNATNYYLGDMIFDPLTIPHPTYTFELNSKDFTEGLTYIKADVIDKANNTYTIIQDLYIFKEGPNNLQDALDFGEIIFYDRDVNYTENPIQFNGFLDNWVSHENKSAVQVDMSYYDYEEELWVPMGTSTLTDGNFVVDWQVDNNTFYKLLPYQRGYIPVNYTFSEQPNNNYFYGSYGYFDDTGVLHPFLVDFGGKIYVYSYNNSNHQWFINFTVDLGFPLINRTIENNDLNKDGRTDLVIFDKLGTATNISIFIFDESTISYQYNQTILASSVSLPQSLPNAVFTEFIFDFNSTPEFLSLYVCLSNPSNSVNYIVKLDFDSDLVRTQTNDGTQLPALRVISGLDIISDNIYIGAINPVADNNLNSSIFYINSDLTSETTFIENATQGALLELASFKAPIGDVVVAGMSMSYIN
ncbi:MAG: hypothetical protein ACW99Q_09540, partial [Candidatus Kariarchaeaceae archaeon]